ncbi:hypothetical protein I3F58_02545 [Streptomyces sp. MUM 203J]|uniref:hypothetical protein n=1 Tax=Streptomyces sp. MUM 203J TaxID=2791990 RepID=UPI001F033121|nr:hypothetical protein [Streptomyces sp. MUM 203J]MCH0538457.1 hypothetical protein [Streptomyces sp. MUM 203J]
MFTQRQISGVLRQIAGQDVVEITEGALYTSRLAALVHLVEHYGFEYADARRHGADKKQITAYLYRDPRPEARAREAATIAAYPQAGNGGPAPGMRPGSLKPLPEAREAVARNKDRIAYDVMAQAAGTQQQAVAWGAVVVLVLVLLVAGMYLGALIGGVLMAGFLVGAFKLGGVRRERIAARLQAAGFVAVRDEHGRQRLLRPGQQLPGHANPFAG